MAWQIINNYNFDNLVNPKTLGRVFGAIIGFVLFYSIGISISNFEPNTNASIYYEPFIYEIPKPEIIPPQKINNKTEPKKLEAEKNIKPQNEISNFENKNFENIKIKSNQIIHNNSEIQNNGAKILPKGPVENNSFNENNNLDGKILNEISQKTLFAIECMKFDEKERPKNCPPSNHAKKLIQFENAPKYNGENVIGFTNAEIKAKKAAGWRDKCEKNEGGQYQVCISVGKKPPRVKTPYELCIEKGLQGCTRPPLPNGEKSELGF